jgi:integrase
LAKSALKLVAPTEVLRTVSPTRRPNAKFRTREHLTSGEVEALIEAAKANRHGHRDATMILLAFRHGLRAAELCDLRWDQVEFNAAVLHVRRVKNGTASTHPLLGDELRALRRPAAREHAVTLRLRQRARHAVHHRRLCPDDRAHGRRRRHRIEGVSADASPRVRLCARQQGARYQGDPRWLGHRSITSTAVYTALAPNRFKDFWRE